MINPIIAIEGGDANGKATQSKLLSDRLDAALFTFPNYVTVTGEAILRHLKKLWSCGALDETESLGTTYMRRDDCDAMVFQCLQTVNRFEMAPAIRAAQNKGPVVLDRYWASAIVYGTLDGLDRKWIETTQASLPEPDAWVLLDVPVEESLRRRPERRDRYERQSGLQERVRASYLRLFEEKQVASRIMKRVGAAMTKQTKIPFTELGLQLLAGEALPDLTGAEIAEVRVPEWHVVNGLGAVEEVHARICKALNLEVT